MNTPAIKPILDYFKVARDAIDNAQRATNTEERERIAELERDNNALRTEVAALKTKGTPFDEAGTVGPLVEEQGPWVIMDGDRVITHMASSAPIEYGSKRRAEGDCMPDERVITLAEARALVAAKTVTP